MKAGAVVATAARLPWWAWVAGGAVAFVLANRLTGGRLAEGVSAALARAAAGAAVEGVKAVASTAGDVVAGTVQGVGDAVGVPRTDATRCDQAIALDDFWRASFDCPALDFMGAAWKRVTGPATQPTTQQAIHVGGL